MTGWNAAIAAVKLATHRVELLDAAGFIVTFLAMIGLFYYLRPRSFQKEVKSQETWRRVDGRWLLVEEQRL